MTLVLASAGCASLNRGDMGWSAEKACGGLWQPTLPMRVVIAPSVESAGWGDAVRAAIEWWGPEFFVLSDDSRGDFIVALDPSMHGMALTQSLFHPTTCEVKFVLVTLPDEFATTPVPARVVAHELGHVLGLADDYDTDSVMNYRVTRQTPLECDLLSGDRDRIESKYARRPRAGWLLTLPDEP